MRPSAAKQRRLLLGIALLIAAATGPASAQINSMKSFVECVNKKAASITDVSSTVSCLPEGCKFTLTMSNFSAQPACFLGGTQLPRLIFVCPGNPEKKLFFRPSYLFCPINGAGATGVPGLDRVEIGQDVTGEGIPADSMAMADLPIAPVTAGKFVPLDLAKVYNRGEPGQAGDKKCNSCHGANTVKLPDDLGLSSPFDPTFGPASSTEGSYEPATDFGAGTIGANGLVIFSNEKDKPPAPPPFPDPKVLHMLGELGQTLPQVCGCITQNLNAIKADPAYIKAVAADPRMGEKNLGVLTNLCTALIKKLDPTKINEPCGGT
jgi:hypothetical protein